MANLACLHLLCGKAGAGKTTLAAALATTHRAILISEDIWLTRHYGEELKTFDDYRTYSLRARTVVGPLVIELLSFGQNIVLDYPANTRNSRAWFRSLYETAGTAHLLHFVDVSDQICLERIEKRNIERPEGSYHLTPQDFAYVSSLFEAPEEEEGLQIEVHADERRGDA